MQAKGLAPEEPARRTVEVEAFCSWSACRMKMRSRALTSTGLTLYSSVGTANIMRMMFAVPTEEYKVSPVLVRALDRIFILHADHEQNASTSTVRLAGSSGANPFACIAAGIVSLWGPPHGGANEACLNMLEEIGD